MMATNVPVVLVSMTIPELVVVAAATVVDAACTAVGLVMPGMVNVRAEPVAKVPAVIVTVNTPAAEMVALPAGVLVAPAVKVRVPAPTTASPAPLSVMTILPLDGMADAGVRVTDMVTPVAPLTALLRVIAGWFVPSVETAVPAMPTASKPAHIAVSELDDSLKPAAAAA